MYDFKSNNVFCRICLLIMLQFFLAGFVVRGQSIVSSTTTDFTVQDSNDIIVYFTVTSPIDEEGQTNLEINLPPTATPIFTFYKDGIQCGCSDKDFSIPTAGNPRTLVIVHINPVSVDESWKLVITGLGSTGTTSGTISTSGSATGSSVFTALHIVPTVDPGPDKTVSVGDVNIEIGSNNNSFNTWNITPDPTLSFSWSQIAGTTVTLDDSTAEKPNILSAPAVSSQETLTFELSVDSEEGTDTLSNTGTVDVIVEPRQPAEFVLVLDHSYSMNSENKWNNTVQAANIFIELLQHLNEGYDTSNKDHYGIVLFTHHGLRWCETYSSPPSGCGHMPSVDIQAQPINIVPPVASPVDVDSLFPGQTFYATPIGDGLQTAKEAFEALDSGGTDKPKFILLLTDGMENAGMLSITDFNFNLWNPVETPNANVRATKIYTIGVGENDIEPGKISSLALITGGDYRLTNETVVLPQFFAQILASAIGAEEVDILGDAYPLNTGENKAAFIVVWDSTEPGGPFFPFIQKRNTSISISPATLSSYSNVTASQQLPGDLYSFFIVEDNSPSFVLGGGDWTFDIVDSSNNVVTPASAIKYVLIDLHLDTTFAFNKTKYYTGDDLILKATIKEGNNPVTGENVKAFAEFEMPIESIGTLFAKNNLNSKKIIKQYSKSLQKESETAKINNDFSIRQMLTNELFVQLGRDYIFKDTKKLQLFDDGLHHDGAPNDGVYANIVEDLKHEGSINVKFTAFDKSQDSPMRFARTETKSTYVEMAPDIKVSDIKFKFLETIEGIKYVKIFITPRSKHGEYFGPFHGNEIFMRSTNGRFTEPIKDEYNGTYTRILKYDKTKGKPLINLFVKDRRFKDLKIKKIIPFGIKGGFNFANLKPAGSDSPDFDWNNKSGFCLGSFITFNLSEYFSIQPEVFFSRKGLKVDQITTNDTFNIDFIDVPLLLKLRLSSTVYSTHIFSGPFASIKIYDNITTGSTVPDIKSFDFGLTFGCGVDVPLGNNGKAISFEGRYSMGLTNIADVPSGADITIKSKVLSFLIGLRF